MRTKFSNSELTHIWAQQSQESGRGSNMYFEGPSIYSYGRHFEIARFVDKGHVLFTSRGYSPTTAKHKSYTLRAISHKTIFTVPSFEDHHENAEYYLTHYKEEIEKASRARKSGEWHLAHAQDYRHEAQEYARLFAKFLSAKEKKAISAMADIDEKVLEACRKRLAEEQKRAIAKRKEDIEKWRAGETQICAIRSLKKIFLRLNSTTEEIETSWGARVPLKAAKLLWHMIKAEKPVHGFSIGNYTVVSYIGGILKIGCHAIEQNEIDRIVPVLE